MLQQNQVETEGAARAADERVSNQELVEAVTAIEARRSDPAFADTITLGDAVRQLSLDVTPEQILAEINAKRAAVATRPSHRRLTSGARPLAVALLVSVLLNFVLL